MPKQLIFLFILLTSAARAQQMKVEFDKATDFSRYRTFTLGEGQILTPKDQRRIPDASIHGWVRGAIADELAKKGLKKVDSAGDLVVSYLTGTEKRSDTGNVGPLGMTPGSNASPAYIRDYQQGSLVIDLNDAHNKALVWRINATTDVNLPESEGAIDQIVEQGFKKFSLKPKKIKKKK
jgi:Domain of unknown function (DUF4136)